MSTRARVERLESRAGLSTPELDAAIWREICKVAAKIESGVVTWDDVRAEPDYAPILEDVANILSEGAPG